MLLNPKPVYRKVIIPWYDSNIVCFATLIFVGLVLLFAVCGIHVAYETPDYRHYLWIPGLVFAMGLSVFISISIRLIYRYILRLDK